MGRLCKTRQRISWLSKIAEQDLKKVLFFYIMSSVHDKNSKLEINLNRFST